MGKTIAILPSANGLLTRLILQLNHKSLSAFPISISDKCLPAGTGQDGSLRTWQSGAGLLFVCLSLLFLYLILSKL